MMPGSRILTQLADLKAAQSAIFDQKWRELFEREPPQPAPMDRKSGVPLYLQLATVIRHQVERPALADGSKVPSLHDLQNEFGVARIAARQAMDRLERDGLISRHKGKGTTVKSNGTERHWLHLTTRWKALMRELAKIRWHNYWSITRRLCRRSTKTLSRPSVVPAPELRLPARRVAGTDQRQSKRISCMDQTSRRVSYDSATHANRMKLATGTGLVAAVSCCGRRTRMLLHYRACRS